MVCDSNRWQYINSYITENSDSKLHISEENQLHQIITPMAQKYQTVRVVISRDILLVIKRPRIKMGRKQNKGGYLS